MPDHKNEKESIPLMTKFFRSCLLALGGVVLLCLALKLLAGIWGWLLLIVVIVGVIWAAIWFARWQRDRRW